ncbi:MAG: transposase, partial [Clostridia bacterium]|nr:transposase [Clostridia bacterium]
MSNSDGFKRCDGFAGSIPQNFINANLPVCPMCGSADPYWTLKDKFEFTAHRILFRCKDCGCILSATQDDFSGTTKSTAYAVLTTGGAVNALVKKKQGKDVKTVYMKVEDAGSAQTSSALIGKELPIDEFKAMAAALSGAAPAVEEPVAAAPAAAEAPAEEPEIKVTYAEPVAAPAAEEPEIKVAYAEPVAAPAPAPAAPVYTAPAPAPKQKKAKAPVASIIFAILAFLGIFVSSTVNLLPNFIPSLGISTPINFFNVICPGLETTGILLFVIGLFLHRKCGNILCGVGIVLFALSTFSYLVTSGFSFFIITDLITVIFLIISAIFYFTKAKVLGMPLKLIFGIFAILAAFV